MYGNRATQFAGTVSIALLNNPGGAVFSGGRLTVAATAGVADFLADFTLVDTAQSGYTIQATNIGTPTPLAPVTTNPIAVTPRDVIAAPTDTDADTDPHADTNTDPHADADIHADPDTPTPTPLVTMTSVNDVKNKSTRSRRSSSLSAAR